MSNQAASQFEIPSQQALVNVFEAQSHQQTGRGSASLPAHGQVKAHNYILDGLGDLRSLNTVVTRVLLAAGVYGGASSMFVFALAQAVCFNMFGWGPLHLALANMVFVVYFMGIMLPFSMGLAWMYRYRQSAPYQRRVLDLKASGTEAFELALGAALSISGTELISADEKTGEIFCRAPKRLEAAAQEIRLQVSEITTGLSRVTVNSQPFLNAIEYLLFGFTLSVDGGRNKANVDAISNFLKMDESVLRN